MEIAAPALRYQAPGAVHIRSVFSAYTVRSYCCTEDNFVQYKIKIDMYALIRCDLSYCLFCNRLKNIQ